MAILRLDIASARLDRVEFRRAGSETPPIKIELWGDVLDVSGTKVSEEVKHYDWSALPAAWQITLLPILKAMSKEFNNKFAAENVETL
uniref:Uncharacterized protein n=1 Tax=viral metagenome TaxID=1070528 RepID=A0A6M3INT8_9ZZZZ